MSSPKFQHKIKLTPLDILHPASKSTVKNRKQRSPSQFISKNRIQRYRTESDIHEETAVFDVHLSSPKFNTNSRIDLEKQRSQKQYQYHRKIELKNEVKSNRVKTTRHHRFKIKNQNNKNILFADHIEIKAEEDGKVNEEQKKKIVGQKLKHLEINFVNMMRVIEAVHNKADLKKIINEVRNYILEEGSDLSEFEDIYFATEVHSVIKTIIYYERVLLILLIQSIIHSKFKINEPHFKNIFSELLFYYDILFTDLSSKNIQEYLKLYQIKLPIDKLISINFKADKTKLFSIRDSLQQKIRLIIRSFKNTDLFVKSQLEKIEKLPTNLLYYNLLQYFAFRLIGNDWSIWGIQFLETCPSPYIHHSPSKKWTLLLDLDETLIHYKLVNSTHGQFLMRPYLFEMLETVAPYFEIGIFTCSLQEYADMVVRHMKQVSIRLYRQHAVRINNELVKDLSRVGRNLANVILVDNLEKNFRLQKDNGIAIKSWYGDNKDTKLKDLSVELMKIAHSNLEDIRQCPHNRHLL